MPGSGFSIDDLQQAIRSLKDEGIKTIDIEKLDAALSKLRQHPSEGAEWKKLTVQLKHQSDLANNNSINELHRKLFEATITFAGHTLKSAILINGGAVVAILAFLGHLGPAGYKPEFSLAMLFYVFGVLFAAMATGASYVAQNGFLHNIMALGHSFRALAIFFVVASYFLFGVGGYTAYLGFIR